MKKVVIIAEAGVNHNGDFKLAKRLIDIAVFSRVDVIKFQTFKTENEISKLAPKANYQKGTTESDESQFEMVKKLEFSYDQFEELSNYCKKKKIIFLSTAFDLESVDFLSTLDMPFWKVPSGLITNLPYLIAVSKQDKPIILSTGMSEISEINNAIQVIKEYNKKEIIIMHCNTEYPTPMRDVNLRAMVSLGRRFSCKYGYSDHTQGISVPIAATALGASIIENHFTLNRNFPGPDHRASLDPIEFVKMVRGIREVETAMGSDKKIVSDSEKKNINVARTSIVAIRNIKKGEVFNEKNIGTKRPGNGISPMRWFDILGKTSIRDFKEDELIEI